MTSTARPSAPTESVAYGRMTGRFNNDDAQAVVRSIEAVDVEFFASYPRDGVTKLDDELKVVIVTEAAWAFFGFASPTTWGAS